MYDTPYQIDDILYVPEEWKYFTTFNPLGYDVEFRDGESLYFEFTDSRRAMERKEYFDQSENQWQSLYFMPCEAARRSRRARHGAYRRGADPESVEKGCPAVARRGKPVPQRVHHGTTYQLL